MAGFPKERKLFLSYRERWYCLGCTKHLAMEPTLTLGVTGNEEEQLQQKQSSPGTGCSSCRRESQVHGLLFALITLPLRGS